MAVPASPSLINETLVRVQLPLRMEIQYNVHFHSTHAISAQAAAAVLSLLTEVMLFVTSSLLYCCILNL